MSALRSPVSLMIIPSTIASPVSRLARAEATGQGLPRHPTKRHWSALRGPILLHLHQVQWPLEPFIWGKRERGPTRTWIRHGRPLSPTCPMDRLPRASALAGVHGRRSWQGSGQRPDLAFPFAPPMAARMVFGYGPPATEG